MRVFSDRAKNAIYKNVKMSSRYRFSRSDFFFIASKIDREHFSEARLGGAKKIRVIRLNPWHVVSKCIRIVIQARLELELLKVVQVQVQVQVLLHLLRCRGDRPASRTSHLLWPLSSPVPGVASTAFQLFAGPSRMRTSIARAMGGGGGGIANAVRWARQAEGSWTMFVWRPAYLADGRGGSARPSVA